METRHSMLVDSKCQWYNSLAPVAREVACVDKWQYRISSVAEVYLVEQALHNILTDFKKEGNSQIDVCMYWFMYVHRLIPNYVNDSCDFSKIETGHSRIAFMYKFHQN